MWSIFELLHIFLVFMYFTCQYIIWYICGLYFPWCDERLSLVYHMYVYWCVRFIFIQLPLTTHWVSEFCCYNGQQIGPIGQNVFFPTCSIFKYSLSSFCLCICASISLSVTCLFVHPSKLNKMNACFITIVGVTSHNCKNFYERLHLSYRLIGSSCSVNPAQLMTVKRIIFCGILK